MFNWEEGPPPLSPITKGSNCCCYLLNSKLALDETIKNDEAVLFLTSTPRRLILLIHLFFIILIYSNS